MWCLGNELDGSWQTGHKTATEYGRLAAETARAMRQFDPTLELVACGSSGRGMATFGTWEYQVLGECFDQVDWISLHAYYDPDALDLASLLASSVDMDRFITSVVAIADAVAAAQRSDKLIMLSFDEWNVWYMSRILTLQRERWADQARLAEDAYTVADAVVVGSLLITLLRRCDRVRAASLAQLVNSIAPIHTEPGGPAWRQTTFHPFAETARHAGGTALQTIVDAPAQPTAAYGDVPVLDAVATRTDDGGLAVFVVNRSLQDSVDVEIDLAAFPPLVVGSAKLLHDDDPLRTNSADEPNAVEPRPHPGLPAGRPAGDRLTFPLPAISWAVLTLVPLPG
jgi:alpha-N-arabinofuranosidase